MILIIDNYDSFTYNLYQYLCELGADVVVVRNDEVSVREVVDMGPDKIVISPGPGTPKDSGISNDVICRLAQQIPILGVCLGHQCIGYCFGATIESAREIMHGKTSQIHHSGEGVFKDLPNPFEAMRYHSLAIGNDNLSKDLKITAWTANGLIMGIKHKIFPLEGIQFHPESILTKSGHQVLSNFLEQ